MNVHIFCIGLASVLGSKLHRNVPTGGSRRRPGGVRDALGRGVWKKHKRIYLLGPPRGHHFEPFGCSWVSFGRHFGVQIEFWTLFFLSDFRHLFFISFLMDLSWICEGFWIRCFMFFLIVTLQSIFANCEFYLGKTYDFHVSRVHIFTI